MKAAVQQPYFFPYSVYYQLVSEVDEFIFFDDVNFIKRGYINRNTIPTVQSEYRFTVPLVGASQNKLINEVQVNQDQFQKWRSKFLQTFKQNHRQGPYFREVERLVNSVLDTVNKNATIADLAIESVIQTSEYLGLKTKFNRSSDINYFKDGSAVEKIKSLCRQRGVEDYINLPGGRGLYSQEDFTDVNVRLSYIEPSNIYFKYNDEKLSGYSILALLAYRSPEEIRFQKEKL